MKHPARRKAPPARANTSWGWSGSPWALQPRKSVEAALRNMRKDGKNAALERSLLCPGFMVPPYVAWRLSRPAREMLRHNVLELHARVLHDLSRPLRFFFENGLEIRITPGEVISVRAIYHTHPWLLHRSAHSTPLSLHRSPIEVKEETLSTSLCSWEERDPEISNHEVMQILARRQAARREPHQAECFDATLSRHIQVSLPERTIFIDRPEGCGFVIRHTAIGRKRLTNLGRSLASPARAAGARNKLRSAAAHVDGCIRGLPAMRRIALTLAADIAPFFRLCEDAVGHLGAWLAAQSRGFREGHENPSPEKSRTEKLP